MIPKWGWPVGVLISALCYKVNRGGFGYESFIAAATLCRLFVTGRIKGESEQYRWVAAVVVAVIGTMGYGMLAGMLRPDRGSQDSAVDLDW